MRFRFRNRGLIQLHRHAATAAFLRAVVVPRVCQEMLQCSKEKRAEPSLHWIGPYVSSVFDQVGKKPLRQILRIVLRDPLAPQEKIDRSPVNLAELRKRSQRVLR